MNFFNDYKKQIFTIVAVILAITAVITMGRKSHATFIDNTLGFVITPVQNVTSSVGDWFSKKIGNIKSDTSLETQNEELKAKVELLEAENKRLSLYEDENKRLSKLLEISQKYAKYDTTGADIIAKDPGNWYYTFLIDKGTKDKLSSDSRSAVAAMSLRTGDLGVVKGDYSLMDEGLCKMEYIDADSEIMQGDEIVTSNLSDVYPAGITIGYVKEIVTDKNGLTKYAVIEPDVDFKHLSTLLVVLNKKEGVTEP